MKKQMVKCKRKDCKVIINIVETQSAYKGRITGHELKQMEGYCTITCQEMDEERMKNEKTKKIAMDKLDRSKDKLIDSAGEVFKSLIKIAAIHKKEVTLKLIAKIKETIEKVEKANK